jgi:hypothetical protein
MYHWTTDCRKWIFINQLLNYLAKILHYNKHGGHLYLIANALLAFLGWWKISVPHCSKLLNPPTPLHEHFLTFVGDYSGLSWWALFHFCFWLPVNLVWSFLFQCSCLGQQAQVVTACANETLVKGFCLIWADVFMDCPDLVCQVHLSEW